MTADVVPLHEEQGPSVPCPSCHRSLVPDDSAFSAFFDGEVTECPSCKLQLDLWKTILDHISEWFVFGDPLVFAGARSTQLKFILGNNELKTIDLTSHGVPQNAEVLFLNFTPSGGAFPILLHGNSPVLAPVSPKFFVLGRGAPEVQPGEVFMRAVWHVADQSDSVIRHLVDAAHEYHHERFDAVVVPANIAAEAALTPVVAHAMSGFAGREKVDDFLSNAATYAHQLNILLPITAYMLRTSKMPDRLRDVLNRLRKLRNKIAHRGAALGQTRGDAAEHLTAAIFAVRYASRLTEMLTTNPLPRSTPTG